MILHGFWDLTTISFMFGSPEVPGIAEAMPGVISMNWSYLLGFMFIVGSAAALFFAREFRKMKDRKQ